MAASVAGAERDQLGAARFWQCRHVPPQLPIGVVGVRVEQRGGELHLELLVVVKEINNRRGIDGRFAHQVGGSLCQIAACLRLVRVRLGVFHQRRCDTHLAAACEVPGWLAGGGAELGAERTHLGELARQEARDLRFQCAGVRDLAERRVRRERQEIPGCIEGTGLERALVGFGLHRLRPGDASLERLEHPRAEPLVRRKLRLDRGGVAVQFGAKIPRGVPTGVAEVLVARRALLPIPALLVDKLDRGQQRQPLDGHGDVGEVGNRAMAVLEVERVQKLLGALRTDLPQRLAQGQRRPRILCHGVGEHLGVRAVDGVDVGLPGQRLSGSPCVR